MKKNLLGMAFVILGMGLFALGCTKADPIQRTNEKLDGQWEATSFITDDNVERLTGEITKNLLVFSSDSIDSGTLSWNIVTPLVQLENWSGVYYLIDDGNTLLFSEMEIAMSFDGDILNLSVNEPDNTFAIRAKKK